MPSIVLSNQNVVSICKQLTSYFCKIAINDLDLLTSEWNPVFAVHARVNNLDSVADCSPATPVFQASVSGVTYDCLIIEIDAFRKHFFRAIPFGTELSIESSDSELILRTPEFTLRACPDSRSFTCESASGTEIMDCTPLE